MTRKKRGRPPKKKGSKKKKVMDLSGDTKRGIVVILLAIFSILFVFGFLGEGGFLGEFLDRISGIIFGWGKWLFPALLILAGCVLLFRNVTWLYYTKIAGLIVIFLTMLGFTHILIGGEDLLKTAYLGQGGGYVGYFISSGLIKLTGEVVTFFILICFSIIGLMVTFNFSVIDYFKGLIESLSDFNSEDKKKSVNESEVGNVNSSSDESVMEESDEINVQTEEISEQNKKDLKDNIKEVRFVEDPYRDDIKKDKVEKKGDAQKEDQDDSKSFDIKKSSDSTASFTWKLPPLDILEDSKGKTDGGNVEQNKDIIQQTFRNFGIDVDPSEIKVGPAVTQYSFRPAVGVKLSRIVALGDDLSLALAAHPIRIEAPIPGKSLIGVEVPNRSSVVVGLRDVIGDKSFKGSDSDLTLALGKDVEGNFVTGDLAKMPHLLVAGATGTGKSVCVNNIILSLLYKNSPEDLKMILVDPKRVELSLYNKIPHLLSNVIVENSKVVNALKWAVGEMENRYKILQDVGSKDLKSYRYKLKRGVKRKFVDPETGKMVEEDMQKMPYIVIVIDELADLMASNGKEVEGAIIRLAQMARAVGMHLIISTQRPSVEVLTGLIKANITTRIALQVATQIDSRTILDMRGAEDLLGRGDMLFLSADSAKPKRIQNAFVSEKEIKRVVDFIRKQAEENMLDEDHEGLADGEDGKDSQEVFGGQQKMDFSNANVSGEADEEEDALYGEAKRVVVEMKKASASLLQRRLRVGYNRAARLIEMLEDNGVIGPADGAKPREVFASADEVNEKKEVNYENEISDQKKRDNWDV